MKLGDALQKTYAAPPPWTIDEAISSSAIANFEDQPGLRSGDEIAADCYIAVTGPNCLSYYKSW
jgi:hypothetical protein